MTLLISGPEPAIAAIVARMTGSVNGLNSFIDQVNLLPYVVADAITIPHPAHVFDYIPSVNSLVDFPTVGVGQMPGVFEDDTAWSATGAHQIAVLAFIQADDEQTLVRQGRRYLLALANCVMRDRSLHPNPGDATPWSLILKAWDAGPSVPVRQTPSDPPARFWTFVTLLFLARYDES